MDYMQSFAVSAAGMSVERLRVDTAALNLANANTVQPINTPSYKPLRVVTRPTYFNELINEGTYSGIDGMKSWSKIEEMNSPPRMVYDPGHPLANTNGFVAYTPVDTATEMMTLIAATRAYEANVVAMNSARSMALKALEIGGNN